MTDINDLVQDFWRTSSDGAIASFFEIRRLFEILQKCFGVLKVCFDVVHVFATAVDKGLQSDHWFGAFLSDHQVDDRIRAKLKRLFDGYRKMIDHSFSKSKDLGDLLRLLPGVVVQKEMSMEGMTVLYRIEPDLLECLIKSTIEPLRPSYSSGYILDDYLSGFLQDRDRSQIHYCDPLLQHISICRHFFSLLDGANAVDLHSYVFRVNLSSRFLKFYVLAMISPITLTVTFMTIYVKPPRIFFMYRTSPTGTLPSKFSIIWKQPHIILMKSGRIISSWRDVLSRLF